MAERECDQRLVELHRVVAGYALVDQVRQAGGHRGVGPAGRQGEQVGVRRQDPPVLDEDGLQRVRPVIGRGLGKPHLRADPVHGPVQQHRLARDMVVERHGLDSHGVRQVVHRQGGQALGVHDGERCVQQLLARQRPFTPATGHLECASEAPAGCWAEAPATS